MSIQFSDTSTYKGLVQLYEREIGARRGEVSDNSDLLKDFAADVNVALDAYLRFCFPKEGKWKLDDTNHSQFPEITTDLVANQRAYLFNSDEDGNLLLDIYRVYIKTNGRYVEIDPVDPDTEEDLNTLVDGLNTTGTPSRYDKQANGIFLDLVPASNVTDGLKVSINREASYFTSADTTKKPGFPGIHHEYFYLRPAYDFARRNDLASFNRIEGALMKLEREIAEHYAKRAKDEPRRLNFVRQNNR